MPSIFISMGGRYEMCINFWENEISVAEVLSPVCKQKMECHNLSGYAKSVRSMVATMENHAWKYSMLVIGRGWRRCTSGWVPTEWLIWTCLYHFSFF